MNNRSWIERISWPHIAVAVSIAIGLVGWWGLYEHNAVTLLCVAVLVFVMAPLTAWLQRRGGFVVTLTKRAGRGFPVLEKKEEKK